LRTAVQEILQKPVELAKALDLLHFGSDRVRRILIFNPIMHLKRRGSGHCEARGISSSGKSKQGRKLSKKVHQSLEQTDKGECASSLVYNKILDRMILFNQV
jgi:hypothetical protein